MPKIIGSKRLIVVTNPDNFANTANLGLQIAKNKLHKLLISFSASLLGRYKSGIFH